MYTVHSSPTVVTLTSQGVTECGQMRSFHPGCICLLRRPGCPSRVEFNCDESLARDVGAAEVFACCWRKLSRSVDATLKTAPVPRHLGREVL